MCLKVNFYRNIVYNHFRLWDDLQQHALLIFPLVLIRGFASYNNNNDLLVHLIILASCLLNNYLMV